jgi:acyl-homoserine lactone acylase PvdQ
MIIPAGNSGHPLSPHFMDFNKDWFDGRRWNVPFSREKVRAQTSDILILKAK